MVKHPVSGTLRRLDLSNRDVAKSVYNLQQAAYLIEANLIHYEKLPPLMESLEELMECTETFIGYFEHNKLAGILSYKLVDQTIDIHRLAVHPNFFRKGIAGQLMKKLQIESETAKHMIVSTGASNQPAAAFYLKEGFHLIDKKTLPDGLEIVQFEKFF